MAGVSVGPASGGRRKELNADVNLVPFIDLLSVCICFLLMTAVWIQLGALEVKQSHGTAGAAMKSQDYEMTLRFLSPSSIDVDLKQGGRKSKTLQVRSKSSDDLLLELDQTISSTVRGLSRASGESPIAAAFVTPKSGVPYGDMVSVLDVLRKNQIVNIGIVPVKGR